MWSIVDTVWCARCGDVCGRCPLVQVGFLVDVVYSLLTDQQDVTTRYVRMTVRTSAGQDPRGMLVCLTTRRDFDSRGQICQVLDALVTSLCM